MKNMFIVRAASAAVLFATVPLLALAPSNADLIPAGREILDYFESQYGSNQISGVNIYERAPNAYLSTGKRGVIWMDNAEHVKLENISDMISDFRKYRPIFCFGWHWSLGPDGGPQDYERSVWERVAELGDNYASAGSVSLQTDRGGKGLAQVVTASGLTGNRTISFEVANEGTRPFEITVWGINEPFRLSTYNQKTPKSMDYTRDVGVKLFHRNLSGSNYDWKQESGTLALGAEGFDYLVVKIYGSASASGRQWIDRVQIEGSAPGSNLIVNPDFDVELIQQAQLIESGYNADNGWVVHRQDVGEVATPGTYANRLAQEDLDFVASWLQILEDHGVPILWRGLHEHGGGWFWYDDPENPENSADLWRYVYDYFTHEKGLDNIIWYYNAAQGLADDWDYRKRFYPGNAYVDFVDVNMYDSDHKIDILGQNHYFDMMTHMTDGEKMIGGGDQPNPHNPDYMAEGRFPRWLLGTTWEGAPFPSREYTIPWARYYFNAGNVISLDEAPAFGSNLDRADLYPDVYPEIGIIAPDFQTWTYDGKPILRAHARDRQGNILQVEFFAYDLTTGTEQSLGLGTAVGEGIYELVWENAAAGFYRITGKATDDVGNVSNTLDMGDTWWNDDSWKNFSYLTTGYFNLAKFKACSASSVFLDRVASRATDGDYETDWESDYTASGDTQNEWLQVDLGAVYPVSQVNLRWDWKAYAETFAIDVSTNGTDWNEVYFQSGFEGETTYAAVSLCAFDRIDARYLRVRFQDMVTSNTYLYFGYKIAELEVPVPLAETPSDTPRHLVLHNRRAVWAKQFERTVYGTPGSVVMSGNGSFDVGSFREEYFDYVGEQLCTRIPFVTGVGQFHFRPYDNSRRDLSYFQNGHLHFWARASVNKTFRLQVRDGSGGVYAHNLELTPQWRRYALPISQIDESVDLTTIREPFLITTSEGDATLYLREVFWSSTQFELSPVVGILDPSFAEDDLAFSLGGNKVDRNDRGTGWKVGELGSNSPSWSKDTQSDRAEVVDGRAQGLVQIVEDRRATTGPQTFSFVATNIEGDSTPNHLRAMVFGVNENRYTLPLITFDEPEFGLGPVDALGPVGDLLAIIEVRGESLIEAAFEAPVELSTGYNEIIILFWVEGVNPSSGDVLWIDSVAIEDRTTSNPDPDGSGGIASELTPVGSWAKSNNSSHVDAGWLFHSASQSRWYLISDPQDDSLKIVSASRQGAPSLVQIIHDNYQTLGPRNIGFDASNVGAGNELIVAIWGVNQEFRTNLWDLNGPVSFASVTDFIGEPILRPTDVADQEMPWRTRCILSGEPYPYGHDIDFGAGYQYLVVQVYTSGVSDSEQMYFANFEIGAELDPSPHPDPHPEPGTNVLVNGDFGDAVTSHGGWALASVHAGLGWVRHSEGSVWNHDPGNNRVEVASTSGAANLVQVIQDNATTSGTVPLVVEAMGLGDGNEVEVFVYGINDDFRINLFDDYGPQTRSNPPVAISGTELLRQTLTDSATLSVPIGSTGYTYLAVMLRHKSGVHYAINQIQLGGSGALEHVVPSVVNGTFETSFIAAPGWLKGSEHLDAGWASNGPGKGSIWNHATESLDAWADDAGAANLAQIIEDKGASTGTISLKFNAVNSGGGPLEIYVYGANELFDLNLYDTQGPRIGSTVVPHTVLVDGQSFHQSSSVSQPLEASLVVPEAGFQYYGIVIRAPKIGVGESLRVDNVRFE